MVLQLTNLIETKTRADGLVFSSYILPEMGFSFSACNSCMSAASSPWSLVGQWIREDSIVIVPMGLSPID